MAKLFNADSIDGNRVNAHTSIYDLDAIVQAIEEFNRAMSHISFRVNVYPPSKEEMDKYSEAKSKNKSDIPVEYPKKTYDVTLISTARKYYAEDKYSEEQAIKLCKEKNDEYYDVQIALVNMLDTKLYNIIQSAKATS